MNRLKRCCYEICFIAYRNSKRFFPTFHLSMKCFLAEMREGNLTLKEAEAAKWLTKDTLYEVQWLPADLSLIAKIEKEIFGTGGE